MEKLPDELLIHICLFISSSELVNIHLVSKRFLKIARDNGLWKQLCQDGSYFQAASRAQGLVSRGPMPDTLFDLQRAAIRSVNHQDTGQEDSHHTLSRGHITTYRETVSWDPLCPGEKVNWYDEYVGRHAPLSLSWLQPPYGDKDESNKKLEARGLGFHENGEGHIVVAPLDDGSVCLWDIGKDDAASSDNDGQIIARSRPGLLSMTGENGNTFQYPKEPLRIASSEVVECVSVDSARNKAYFAVGPGLNEVDLATLQISAYDCYPWTITALSKAAHPTPLTIGTTKSLHLHDPRHGNNESPSSATYFSETVDTDFHGQFPRLHEGHSANSKHALLYKSSPLSILHLNPSSAIYVAGRFPSLLKYDRRYFPKLASTIYSGARLSCLTSLPTPDAPTLAAAGEYNGKGSLEFYPLDSSDSESQSVRFGLGTTRNKEPRRNRTSASRSKILSLTTHGTRLLFSDSDGQLKWVERDGSSLVRRWNINTYSTSLEDPIPTHGIFNNEVGEGDVARKMLPVSSTEKSEVLLWTGEKIGLLSFKKKARFEFGASEEEEERQTLHNEVDRSEPEERNYERMMRMALERQADEARFMQGLGLRG